jgi:hypothetical protein
VYAIYVYIIHTYVICEESQLSHVDTDRVDKLILLVSLIKNSWPHNGHLKIFGFLIGLQIIFGLLMRKFRYRWDAFTL